MEVSRFYAQGILCSVVLMVGSTTQAEEYTGAKAVLDQIAASLQEKSKETTTEEKPTDTLTTRMEEFSQRAGDLPPQKVAQQWLALVDLLAAQPREQGGGYSQSKKQSGLSDLVSILPGPEVWPALGETIDARPVGEGRQAVRERSLRMFAHTLAGDFSALLADLEIIEQRLNRPGNSDDYWQTSYLAEELATAIVAIAPDAELSVSLLQSRIEQLSSSADQANSDTLAVPDLVTLVGSQRAENILRQALLKNASLEISVGEATKKLARKLSIELIEKLVAPQWSLCQSIKSIDLFEALQARFEKSQTQPANRKGAKKSGGLARMLSRLTGFGETLSDQEDSYELRSARVYYFLGLLAADRTQDAVKIHQGMKEDSFQSHWFHSAMEQLRKAGRSEQVYEFYRELLSRNIELNHWEAYISIASETGHGKEMLQAVMTAAANPKIKEKQRKVLQRHLRDAFLAVGKIDEAVALLREELAACNSPTEKAVNECMDAALKLAELGNLLDRQSWLEEGLQFAQKIAKAAPVEGYYPTHSRNRLMDLLLKLDRGPASEQLAKQQLADSVDKRGSEEGSWMPTRGIYASSSQALSDLLHVYAQADRHDDVLVLLKEAPWWGEKDLALLDSSVDDKKTLLLDVAEALAETGEASLARSLVEKSLHESSGNDRAYQILLELEGQEAMPLLMELAERDRFEERPLIWRAKLLLEAGQVDEAERVLKQAISIDPSDGEQGKGDRMRAYAVLADVHQARGDDEQEEFFRRVIRAIRRAEEADDFYSVGLKMRGISMYREALLQFKDAYCIQSRMAIQLAQIGKVDEAAVHYQRAFELMPDSFGRVESHCFGCEKAFSGGLAQTIAERVFADFLQKHPDKPQVHYLVGYLRSSQDRHTEALAAYSRAVKLDPDYLNAWEKILDLGENIFLPRDRQDEATFNLIRLDPLGKHVGFDAQEVADLAQLWEVFTQSRPQPVSMAKSLFPLEASRRHLEEVEQLLKKARSQMQTEMDFAYAEMSSWQEEEVPQTAGELLSQHSVISVLCTLFDDLCGEE